MKKKVLTILFGSFISLVFIIALYNFLPSQPYIRFSLLIFFYFAVPTIAVNLTKVQFSYIFLSLIIPTTFIDISTFYTNPSLIPLRFPISTIYPILGGMMSYMLIIRSSYRWLWLFICVAAIAAIQYFYPVLEYDKFKKQAVEVVQKKDINQISFINIDGKTVRLSDTLETKVHLLEFFFVHCLPCQQKKNVLKKITKKFKDNFSVIHICDGILTNFEQFQTYARENSHPGFIFLYAPDSTLRKSFGDSLAFPFEQLIFEENKVISTEMGFSPEVEKLYYDNKINIITKYLQK